jgi:hypothetical protein
MTMAVRCSNWRLARLLFIVYSACVLERAFPPHASPVNQLFVGESGRLPRRLRARQQGYAVRDQTFTYGETFPATLRVPSRVAL